jgi:hypothetical protein
MEQATGGVARAAGSGLAAEHRRLLLIDQGIGSVLFNFVFNAGIAWLTVWSLATIPLWGNPSVAVDTIATAFILPFLTAVIVTRLIARQVASGKLPPLPPQRSVVSAWVARSSRGRGARLGVGSIVFAALPVVLVLTFFGPASFDRGSFIWFKAGFAAVLAGIVSPFIAWWALVEASTKRGE